MPETARTRGILVNTKRDNVPILKVIFSTGGARPSKLKISRLTR